MFRKPSDGAWPAVLAVAAVLVAGACTTRTVYGNARSAKTVDAESEHHGSLTKCMPPAASYKLPDTPGQGW